MERTKGDRFTYRVPIPALLQSKGYFYRSTILVTSAVPRCSACASQGDSLKQSGDLGVSSHPPNILHNGHARQLLIENGHLALGKLKLLRRACISPPTTTASALSSLKRMGSKPRRRPPEGADWVPSDRDYSCCIGLPRLEERQVVAVQAAQSVVVDHNTSQAPVFSQRAGLWLDGLSGQDAADWGQQRVRLSSSTYRVNCSTASRPATRLTSTAQYLAAGCLDFAPAVHSRR